MTRTNTYEILGNEEGDEEKKNEMKKQLGTGKRVVDSSS